MAWVVGIITVFLVIAALNGVAKSSKEAAEKAEFSDKKKSRADAYSDFILREEPDERFKGMTKSELKEDIETRIEEFKKASDNAHIIPAAIWLGAAAVGILIGISNENWAPAIMGIVGGGYFAYSLDKQAVAKVEAKYKSLGYLPEKLKIDQ